MVQWKAQPAKNQELYASAQEEESASGEPISMIVTRDTAVVLTVRYTSPGGRNSVAAKKARPAKNQELYARAQEEESASGEPISM